MRNIAYALKKDKAKIYITRLLRLGYSFEVSPHIRFVEVTVNQESPAPPEAWVFDMANNRIQD